MKKIFISSASIAMLFSFSLIGSAETVASYDSNQSVGFTGIYSPPEEESLDNENSGMKKSEIQALPQAVIPDAGDSSNALPIFLAVLSALGALVLTKRLRKQEGY